MGIKWAGKPKTDVREAKIHRPDKIIIPGMSRTQASMTVIQPGFSIYQVEIGSIPPREKPVFHPGGQQTQQDCDLWGRGSQWITLRNPKHHQNGICYLAYYQLLLTVVKMFCFSGGHVFFFF